jgi:phosphoribosylformylglycinamidine synthase
MKERKWLYQTPMDILIKASNGASDFGNKFGQPLITGSVLTFEHEENNRKTWLRQSNHASGWNWLRKIRSSHKKNHKKATKS